MQRINDEIDQAPDDPTPAEKQRQKMELLTKSVQGGIKPSGDVKDVEAA